MFENTYARDGWKCRFCKTRQNLQGHHIIYRSHGGPDESWNICTLCITCHIEGVHGGNLRVLAKSGDPQDRADANVGLKFVVLNGWRPNGNVHKHAGIRGSDRPGSG